MTSQIYTLKPLDEGADPATFYALLGCETNEGRLYRRDIQYKGMGKESEAIWDAQEMWRIEACFFTAEDGLSGWKRSALVMGRGWFVPVKVEAVQALSAYMEALQPTSALKRRLESSEGNLVGANLWLKRALSAGELEEGAEKTVEQRRASGRVAELEQEISRSVSDLEAAEVLRLEAQTVLLTTLGWGGIVGSYERGQ